MKAALLRHLAGYSRDPRDWALALIVSVVCGALIAFK